MLETASMTALVLKTAELWVHFQPSCAASHDIRLQQRFRLAAKLSLGLPPDP